MNQEPCLLTKNKPAVLHCSARTPSGRRCRMAVSDAASGLCFRHAAEKKRDRDAANLAAQLIGDTGEFTSALTINRSLGELYKLLARDEIAPRRAAVMAYTCSLLLRTLPAIEHELNPPDQEQQILFDVPRPTDHDDPERTLYKSLAEHYGRAATLADSDLSTAPTPSDDFFACAPIPEKTK